MSLFPLLIIHTVFSLLLILLFFLASIWYASMGKVKDFRALGEGGRKGLQSRSEKDVNKLTSVLSFSHSL